MNTVTLTIQFPFIVPPAHFKVRYRNIANPTIWVTAPDQTNLPFNVQLPVPGQYEFGISYVDADGETCAEVIYPTTVVDVCPCITITGASVKRDVPGGPVHLNIPYTGAVNFPCGLIVKHMPNGYPPALTTKASVRIFPVPASPIKVPVVNLVPHDIEVWTDCCDGNVQQCFTATIPADPEPTAGCVGVTLSNTQVTIVQSVATGKYYLQITFPGPAPLPSLCNGMYVVYTQIRIPSNGGYVDRGTTAMPAANWYAVGTGMQIRVPLNPNPNVDFLGIRYNAQIFDCCGNMTPIPTNFTGTQIP